MSELFAKKRFGQHFLVSTDAIRTILEAARMAEGLRVLEIGPGAGALTASLRVSRVDLVAVELDREAAALLRERWPDLKLVEADAMKVNWAEVCPDNGWTVVANLPYNVAVPILMGLLDHPLRFPRQILMFQKEVADRIQAMAGNRTYGSLSVQVQARARIRRVLNLGPAAFRPPPKVDSTVLCLEPYAEPDFGGVDGDTFDKIVRLAFSQRRKTLLNALGSGISKPKAAQLCEMASVDASLRAEVLDLAAYRRLAGAWRSLSVES